MSASTPTRTRTTAPTPHATTRVRGTSANEGESR